MANVSTIRTEDDYEAALARIAEILHAEIGTPEGDELDVLVDLVELYEEGTMPSASPAPYSWRADSAATLPGQGSE